MGLIDGLGGNFGIQFSNNNVGGTRATGQTAGAIPIGNLNHTTTDVVQFSKTPGNTGVNETTARGFLRQLDDIVQVGF
ncbi:hypothetical protein IJ579_03165 [bacterium]|nr:hypothetical protein [bacterium]